MNSKIQPKIVIIGAGPTGLGAAWRLMELQQHNWTIIDAGRDAGGLAGSVVDPQGFVWDKGGHVLFSHYDYFDQLLDLLLADEWVDHARQAWVWMRQRFIPYPFQNNVWRLPQNDLALCIKGLKEIAGQSERPVHSFKDWILTQFGQGLADLFFLPYNYKVWAYDPDKLDAGWVGERVATVDIDRILRSIDEKKDDAGWGPNASFRFPLKGGTGEIWRRLAALIPAENCIMGASVERIEPKQKFLELSDGRTVPYDFLITTMPLDNLLDRLVGFEDIANDSNHRMLYSSTNLVGIGLSGQAPEQLRSKNWMYFCEPEYPFYRITVFSNYSPYNVPDPQSNWSLLCEVSESSDKPVDQESLVSGVIEALKWAAMIPTDEKPLSIWQHRLEHGYPTPFLGRDRLIDPLHQTLLECDIYSRGRFGAWKYEVSNQDHSLMQGVEVVDRLLLGQAEVTLTNPSLVNSRRNADRQIDVAAASFSKSISQR